MIKPELAILPGLRRGFVDRFERQSDFNELFFWVIKCPQANFAECNVCPIPQKPPSYRTILAARSFDRLSHLNSLDFYRIQATP
jgi:hypothetical protein